MKKSLLLFLTIVFFAVGNILFAVPNTIMNGGVTGLSMMAYYVLGLNIGLGIFLLNLPLFILAFLFYRELFYKSVISMIVLSIVIGVLQDILLPYGIKNIWIGSLVGGYWMGLALGVMAKMNSSLGGGSLLGKMLHEKFGFSLSKAIFFADASVFPLSLLIIGAVETTFSLVLAVASALGVATITRLIRAVEKPGEETGAGEGEQLGKEPELDMALTAKAKVPGK